MPSVIAYIKVKDDKISEAREFLGKLARDTVANEKGTLAYVAHQRKDDPTTVVFYEKYDYDAAFAGHGENLKAHGKSFAAIMAGPPEILFLDEL